MEFTAPDALILGPFQFQIPASLLPSGAIQMRNAEDQIRKMTKRASRKPPKKLVVIGVRVDDNFLRNLMDWISENEPDMTRPEAIRRLVELGMKAKTK